MGALHVALCAAGFFVRMEPKIPMVSRALTLMFALRIAPVAAMSLEQKNIIRSRAERRKKRNEYSQLDYFFKKYSRPL